MKWSHVVLKFLCQFCSQESNPNSYAKLHNGSCKGKPVPTTPENNTTVSVFENSVYTGTLSLPSAEEQEVAYEYIPQEVQDDEYDYESPYWAPAEKKNELLRQFKKLRIPSVPQKDLE